MGYEAIALMDSVSEAGVRLLTMKAVMPRVVLAEINTHRWYSRNSASSRAIPVEKVLTIVASDPFIPQFTRNQKGMAGKVNDDAEWQARQEQRARNILAQAVHSVKLMVEDGVHKQDANRYLEPFLWHTVIITGTQPRKGPGAWSNFFAQRTPAENTDSVYPPMYETALAMKKVYDESKPVRRPVHAPLLTYEEWETLDTEQLMAVSAARCARVSTLREDDFRDLAVELEFTRKLREGGHWSPLEHQAVAMADPKWSGNLFGWIQYRKTFDNEAR